MLMAVEEKLIVERRVQMTFDFVSPEDIKARPRRKKRVTAAKNINVEEPIINNVVADGRVAAQQLQDVCVLLHDLGRKHIPPTEFSDYTTFARCNKILCEIGAIKEPPVELNATITDHDAALVTHAPQYRLLRNRAIAGLATVADLGTKAPAKGSPDYQQGMRDAYQQASDIAVWFLEDLEECVERLKKN